VTDNLLGDRAAVSPGEPPSAGEAGHVAARASHMMGSDVEREWAGSEAIAWEGFLEVARRVRRGAEEALIEKFDLSISMLGVTGRLSLAPERTLRQTALADAMGLSLSRVSRVIDLLEQRGLVERQSCPADARATNVKLTRQGATLTARAQQELFTYVQATFFDRLDASEVETLAAVFTRLLDLPATASQAC
jgi:DNA-binding MarR family transcriptional regulator